MPSRPKIRIVILKMPQKPFGNNKIIKIKIKKTHPAKIIGGDLLEKENGQRKILKKLSIMIEN